MKHGRLVTLLGLLIVSASAVAAQTISGVVVDAESHEPIPHAIMTDAQGVRRADETGRFSLDAAPLRLRYERPATCALPFPSRPMHR